MASRVAARLGEENGVEVEAVKGGLGEFSVYVDGQKAIDTTRFWYPNPTTVVRKVRALMAK